VENSLKITDQDIWALRHHVGQEAKEEAAREGGEGVPRGEELVASRLSEI